MAGTHPEPALASASYRSSPAFEHELAPEVPHAVFDDEPTIGVADGTIVAVIDVEAQVPPAKPVHQLDEVLVFADAGPPWRLCFGSRAAFPASRAGVAATDLATAGCLATAAARTAATTICLELTATTACT